MHLFRQAVCQHLKTHSREKLYNCNQCNFASVLAGNLRRRLKTHSGKKSFKFNQWDYIYISHNHTKSTISGPVFQVPGRPSWMRRCLVSRMVKNRAATAFCSTSQFENMWLWSMWFFTLSWTFFNFGHCKQCSCVSSDFRHKGHILSFWMNECIKFA